MAVTYSADQVALLINTLTARNSNETIERLLSEKPKNPTENLSRVSTNDTDGGGTATDHPGTFAGTEQRSEPGQTSANPPKRRLQERESNSHGTDVTPPPPPLKKRGPKPLTDKPVSKRAEQNRVAQRAHRERKQHYVKSLEEKIVTLESESELLRQRNAELQAQLDDALAALSQDKPRRDSLVTSESIAPLAASETHQAVCPTVPTSASTVTDIDNRGIANLTNNEAVDEIQQSSVPHYDTSDMAGTIGNTDLYSPEIQAIFDNPDFVNVGHSGNAWDNFWTAWDSQVPLPDTEFDELCCQAERLNI